MHSTVEHYKTAILNTANLLTILRIVVVPLFLIALTGGSLGAALALFVAAGLTDALDGIIARRYGQKTSIGAVLDPLADKLLMTTSFIVLALPQMDFPNRIPLWLMILVLSRDVFILLVSLITILMVGWRIFRPTVYGKISTVLQVATVIAVLYANWRGGVYPQLAVFFYAAGFMTVWSGLHYLIREFRRSA